MTTRAFSHLNMTLRPYPAGTVKAVVGNRAYRLEDQNHQTMLNVTAKKMATAMTIDKFTLVVRL
jgi:hypothetical protein